MHRLHDHRHVQVDIAQPGHAHQFRHAVDLGGTRAALARLTIPAHRHVRRLLGLDPVDGIQHHHPLLHLGRVIDEFAALRIAAPDSKHRLRGHLFHLLDHRLQLSGQRRDRPLLHQHPAIRTAPHHDVELAPLRILIREVFAELCPAALLAE